MRKSTLLAEHEARKSKPLLTMNAIATVLNEAFHATARQRGLPARCKRKGCRNSGHCSALHPLGEDCASSAQDGFYEAMIDHVDYALGMADAVQEWPIHDHRPAIRLLFLEIMNWIRHGKKVQRPGWMNTEAGGS